MVMLDQKYLGTSQYAKAEALAYEHDNGNYHGSETIYVKVTPGETYNVMFGGCIENGTVTYSTSINNMTPSVDLSY